MIRTGIATSESIGEVLENAGTPLTYGATAESWREALTTISGTDGEITPRETENATGWASINETVLKTFNNETATEGKFTVDIVFVKDGESVEVESVRLNGIEGVREGDHYEFAGIDAALEDVELTYTFDGQDYTETKTYLSFTDDVVVIA